MTTSAAKEQTCSMTAVGAEKDMSLQIERYVFPACLLIILETEADPLARLYQTNALSDLIITCGGQDFAVHKIILYIQSEYFRKLLDGSFKVRSELISFRGRSTYKPILGSQHKHPSVS